METHPKGCTCSSCWEAMKESLLEKPPADMKQQPEKPQLSQVGGSHYKDLAIQPVEFCQRNGLGYCESSVVKYVCRHRRKNGRQDIEKAIHFLQLLLEIEYPLTNSKERA